MKQTISGTYIAEKHSIINNRVRKNAHTISGNKLTISILSATTIWTTIGRLFITSSPCPKLGGSYFPERQLWVSPGLAWEPYLRLLRAWTGAPPFSHPGPTTASTPLTASAKGVGSSNTPAGWQEITALNSSRILASATIPPRVSARSQGKMGKVWCIK